MAIIKKTTIIDKGTEKALDPLISKYEKLNTEQEKLVNNSKELQKQLTSIKKTNDGSEAKKLVKVNQELVKTNKELTDIEKERERVNKQAKATMTKILVAEEKRTKTLQKGKIALQEKNKQQKLDIQISKAQEGSIEKLRLTTRKLTQQRDKLGAITGKNIKQFKSLTGQINKNNAALAKQNRAIGRNQDSVGKYSNALKGLGKQILGATGLVGGVSALIGVFRNAGKVFINFEKSSSRLAAILGKSKDEIKALTEQAKQLGATTAFTASQVIELQTELAKLGFTTKQIEASTEGILNLAAATGQDLAQSAELAGATLRIFNLDASEMGRVTDVLAKSTSISSLSMEKLATILPTVGKTAEIAGVSLEKTAALAGTLTDRGLDASSAATSLRNIFLELSKKGLTWEQAMSKINKSTDKNKTSMDLFGKRAAAAGVILSETATSTDDLTTALEQSKGAAQEMADTMLDNLAGDITKSKSAWEGFILSLEEGNGIISKFIRNVTQYFTGLFQALTNLNNESAKLDEFSKKRVGLTKLQNDALKRQDDRLGSIADKNKRAIAANKERLKFEAAANQAGLDALRAKEDGDSKALIKAQAQIDLYKTLSENAKKYLPVIKLENTEIEKENDNVTKLTTSEKKLYNQRKKEDEERKRRAKIKLEGGETPEVVPYEATSVDTEDPAIQATKKLVKNLADINDNARQIELDKEKEQAEAINAIKNTFAQEALNYASILNDTLVDDKKNKELNRIQSEEDALKNQLDKGLINQIEYDRKLGELNKRRRIAEARAEKRKALYDIAIATAVAIVKVLPNFVAAALVAAQGAVRAAFVAARPLPKFKEGGEIGGNLHSNGGTVVEAEKGEFILNRAAYANAPMLANAINSGKLTDRNSNMIGLGELVSSNKRLVGLMSNMAYSYQYKNMTIIVPADGSDIIKKVND